MAFTISGVRLDGCLFGPPSERDYRTVFRDRAVPDRVDLRPHCTAVENQGQIGSCTANAAVGALEYHYKRRDGRSPDLSRMFVYFNARRMRGQVMFDTGAQIREAMASLMAFGACREELWPYDPVLFALEPTADAYKDANIHEAIEYARVAGGRGAIQALAQALPVVFGTVIPQRCFEEAARTGVIPAPSAEERAAAQGGHAMLIVGYDNPRRMFSVRNSWGEDWGEGGYCQIPYDVMDSCCRPEDFWVISELEKETGFQLIRPERSHAGRHGEGRDYEHERKQPAALQPSGILGTTSKIRDQIRAGLEADISAASKRIDELLSGGKLSAAGAGGGKQAKAPLPCTACAGTGVCVFCHGRKPGCVRCDGSGICADCGGTGVI